MATFQEFSSLINESIDRVLTVPNTVACVVEADFRAAYLAAIPAEINPIFAVNPTHQCSGCLSFVGRFGGIVAVHRDGRRTTIWDEAAESTAPYAAVAKTLRDLAMTAKIADKFLVKSGQTSFGSPQNRVAAADGGAVATFYHFALRKVPQHLRVPSPAEAQGAYRTSVQVFERALREIAPRATTDILDLIERNDLYRGAEHKHVVMSFVSAQQEVHALPEADRDGYVWFHAQHHALAHFRASVIGTLAVDLTAGMPIEDAVRSFEAKVAPANYRRPTAPVSATMVERALKDIRDAGLEPALTRRLARIEDISVTDVLWVDAEARPVLKHSSDLEAALMTTVKRQARKAADNAADIGMTEFLTEIMPKAEKLEVLFEHPQNLVALTAPSDPEHPKLFNWDNGFGWSYRGGFTDSVKERVKRAGGNVDDAALRVSLAWSNTDDLDLSVVEPDGDTISCANKRGRQGGALDVDMNVMGENPHDPVENISWRKAPDGVYTVRVTQYRRRNVATKGFSVEVAGEGSSAFYSYDLPMGDAKHVDVVRVRVRNGVIADLLRVDPKVTVGSAAASRKVWGVETGQFAQVSAVTYSPNHWGDQAVGNRHVIFALRDAHPDQPVRGVYNEFLAPGLEKHRKVLELVGEKTQCPPSDDGLAGVGFSDTKSDRVTIRVTEGKRTRTFAVDVTG